MKALVYHGPGEKRWESKPDLGIEQPEDAIIRIDTTTICGTDLHILKGDVPTVGEGRTLGHEAVGTVVESGSAVRDVHEGDRVLVSCISSCGRCDPRPSRGRYAGRARAYPVRGQRTLKSPRRTLR